MASLDHEERLGELQERVHMSTVERKAEAMLFSPFHEDAYDPIHDNFSSTILVILSNHRNNDHNEATRLSFSHR